jgi:hypothetical protein
VAEMRTVWETYLDALVAVQNEGGENGASASGGRGGALRVRSDAELEEMPAMSWLADGILPLGGLAAIYGAPGAGKSFVALDLVFSVATGARWLGRSVAMGGALYIAGEGLAGLSQRIIAWKDAHRVLGQSVGVGIVSDGVDLMNPADVSRIAYAARADQVAKPIRLVVLDTLARSMIGDENDTRDMSTVISAADRIRHATGAAVLLVHHTRKDSDQERGSTALRGAVDTLLYCEEGDEGRQLLCQKQKDAEPFTSIPFRLAAGHSSCVVQASGSGSSEDAREQSGAMTPKRLVALRALHEGFTVRGATTTEWLKACALPDRTFYRVRTWLVSEGYVSESPRGGRFLITQSGRTATATTANGTAKPTANQMPNLVTNLAVGSGNRGGSPESGSTVAVSSEQMEEDLWSDLLEDADRRTVPPGSSDA